MTDNSGLCVVEVERVRRMEGRFGKRFLERLFTPGELAYSMPRAARFQHLACRLAAKVAARTALRSAGIAVPRWRELDVRRDEWGRPFLAFPEQISCTVLLSLSHSRTHAVASAAVKLSKGSR